MPKRTYNVNLKVEVEEEMQVDIKNVFDVLQLTQPAAGIKIIGAGCIDVTVVPKV